MSNNIQYFQGSPYKEAVPKIWGDNRIAVYYSFDKSKTLIQILDKDLRKDYLKHLKPDKDGFVLLGKYLGHGVHRLVTSDPLFPNTRVIKIAYGHYGSRCDNMEEYKTYMNSTTYQKEILAKIFNASPGFFMLSMERVPKLMKENKVLSSRSSNTYIIKSEESYKNCTQFRKVIARLKIMDLHLSNIGVKNNKLKIIDYACKQDMI